MQAMKIYPLKNVTSSKTLPNKRQDTDLCVSKYSSVPLKEGFKLLNYASAASIIPFCARKKAKPDDVKREARELCARCHYGKADILDNPDKLKIKRETGKLFLEGYYNDNGELTGVCEELAHKTGTFLREKFKKDYMPLLISFSEKKYGFSEHVCVVMIKRNEINDAQMKGIENLEYGKNLNDIEGFDGQSLFDGAIFIDPSFNIVCDIEKMPPDYTDVVSMNTIEKNNPYNAPREIIPGANNYLGYLKDICPELSKINFPPNAMVSFVVPKNKAGGTLSYKKVVFRVHLPQSKRYIEGTVKDLKKALPHSKFTAFMTKLEEELMKGG